MAYFVFQRRATCTAHALSSVWRPRCITTVAAWHNARRRLTSPALVMSPETSRAPDSVLGEVEVGTFRLDESDLIAVKAFADGATA